jgi:hypothetical protein
MASLLHRLEGEFGLRPKLSRAPILPRTAEIKAAAAAGIT